MKDTVLIVEDQYVEADYLRLMLIKVGYKVCGIARSVLEAQAIIAVEKPGLVILDIFLKGKLTGIDLAKQLRQDHIAFIYLSANSNEDILTAAKATEPYGFLVKPFREKDLLVALEIAQYRHTHSTDTRLRKEAILQNELVSIFNNKTSREQKLLDMAKLLQPYLPFDYMTAGFNGSGGTGSQGVGFLRIGFDEYQTLGTRELLTITGIDIDNFLALQKQSIYETTPSIFNGPDFITSTASPSLTKLFAHSFFLQSQLSLPLHLSGGETLVLDFYSRRPDSYQPAHLSLFNRLENSWTKGIERLVQNPPKAPAMPADPRESAQRGDSIFEPKAFDGIIGSSHLLLNVLDLISIVAPAETSVLILGESGTGKERIADCIHRLSPRNKKPFIKINCAALPPALIESELFGHEKGAFTGALEKRIGKFEQADGGTIFLDEIGEMPLELQVKLLRVLQEKQIERLGARSTVQLDVRIIAATNRNLEKEVAEGRFRLDLYYRLNVFPVTLPALRERKEDIPALTAHFISYYNRKTGKKVTGISEKALKKLSAWSWPGNIRELEYLVERSILLSKETTIEDVLLPSIIQKENTLAEPSRIKTMHENERDHIMNVLKKCNGKIWGPGAAAEILNLPPTTLKSKMKKLGIRRVYID